MAKTPLLEVGETVGDDWTVVAVVTPRSFIVECACGRRDLKKATELYPNRGRAPRQHCGH